GVLQMAKDDSEIVSVRFPKKWLRALDAKAEELHVSRSDLIRGSVPLPEQIAKSTFPQPTVPRGEVHDRKEDLTQKHDFSQQSARIETTLDPSQPRPKTLVIPRSNKLGD